MNDEPKGKITRSDIDIVFTFSSRVETICAQLGYNHLCEEAKTVQRIARMALYEANYEIRRERVRNHTYIRSDDSYQKYPYSVDEEGAEPDDEVARFMHRSADDHDEQF